MYITHGNCNTPSELVTVCYVSVAKIGKTGDNIYAGYHTGTDAFRVSWQ